MLDAWMWARKLRDADGSRPGLKESLRWIEGYERLAKMAPRLPTTRLVYLADREADIMALMVRSRDLGEPVDWLLRSKHNRSLSEEEKLWSRVTYGESVGEIRFTLASRQGHPVLTPTSGPGDLCVMKWAQGVGKMGTVQYTR